MNPVAGDIVVSDLRGMPDQESLVTHPVRQLVGEPRASFRAVVVGAGSSHSPCEFVFPMHAFRDIGNAHAVGNAETGMLPDLLVCQLVGADVQSAPPLRERYETGDSHRPLDQCGYSVADPDVLEVTGLCAADLLIVVLRVDLPQLSLGVRSPGPLLHVVVLRTLLARGIALGPEAPRVPLA